MDDSPSHPAPDATALLLSHSRGEVDGAARLLPLVYDELRAVAAEKMRGEDEGHTLHATALVHEAYLRLIDLDRIDWQGETHFKAMAALTMRRVLIDHARGKHAQKRGGKQRPLTLTGDVIAPVAGVDWSELTEALGKLGSVRAGQAELVELRLFGGFTLAQAAEQLGLSLHKAKRDWRLARAWLNRELTMSPKAGHESDPGEA